jgi:hypothetical protein
MATQPIVLQFGAARQEFWERFRRELALRVQECNAVAGEALWEFSGTGEPVDRIIVQRLTCPGDRVECAFDVEMGVLVCTPGPAICGQQLRFEWTAGTLLLGKRPCCFDEAVQSVLDELIAIEEE